MNLARYCLENAGPKDTDTAPEVIGPSGACLEKWSYGRLSHTIRAIGAGLKLYGLERGDRILIRLGHSSDFPLVFFGAIAGGFVPVPTSDLLTAAEADQLFLDSGARVVVHDGRTALPPSATAVVGPAELEALKAQAPGPIAGTKADDPAFLIYTSGTSGTPKGVLHAQRAAAGRRPMYDGWYGIERSDRLMHGGAFNWTYTLGVGLMDPWANGATSLVYDGPRDPRIWLDLIENSGATLFAAVPSLYRRILKYGTVSAQRFPSLRHGLSAGEALSARLHDDWVQQTGRPLYEALGMSEISTYISSGPRVPTRPGSSGKPQAGRKVDILKEGSGQPEPAPTGEVGLLAVHRDEQGLMLGYWGKPAETAEAFWGGWFLTGDRAHRDEEDYYWYDGRADDVMNAFGYRVAPEEVERALSAHPNVAEVAVVDVPIREGVSLITAFIVPHSPGFRDETALAEHARKVLAEYKRPKAYRFVRGLPRTPSGKLRRKALISAA
ncbi:MAG: AMP-binding protein [Roseibium sp.]|nr:AMP-binding protein [Roseibium sp.]